MLQLEEILEKIEKTLEKKIERLKKDLLGENNADQCSASYNFFAVTVPEIQREVIQKCRKALAKIKDGTFGTCENCGERISLDRLKELSSFELCSPSKCS
ncbi:MAG: RNA polymerase-binding protein DksA [Candidatus Portnoybacteria bacterium]|nr:RNA polymerase-binding protein DksA [Candidatus Portnoybacteria bacterium]